MMFETTLETLVSKIPNNHSGSEIELSVGQSLLIVIDVFEQNKTDTELLSKLKRLYLEGIKTIEDNDIVRIITKVLSTKNYKIKSDPITVNADSTRRYFETHLAYYILQNKAESLETPQLEQFTLNLKQRLLSLLGKDKLKRQKVEAILGGDINEPLLNKYELEYAELTHKLLKQNFYGLSEKACKNLYYIACSTILSTLNTQVDKSMPVDIYSNSIFTMGLDGRGRIVKSSHDNVRTTAKGLMTSISPLPRYHDLVNPVECNYSAEVSSPFQRSADQADFMIESPWSQFLFSRQTQLYSNGISSTTLAQIRNIILQKRMGNTCFSKNFQNYITIFAALMVYNSGGHSFFEIFEVLKLPLCQELLSSHDNLHDAVKDDSIMVNALFLANQQEFEMALEATQRYAKTLLQMKVVNAEIKEKKQGAQGISLKQGNKEKNLIHDAVLNPDLDELKLESYVDELNQTGWSPLMVAAQLGKTKYIQKLVDAGADIAIRVDGLSPLDLAIKNQQLATVKLLLELSAPAKVEDKSKKALKHRAPALYQACYQNDMRILDTVLNKVTWSIQDKMDAIIEALKIENLEAIKVLCKHINSEEKQTHFSAEYKDLLQKEIVASGNVYLFHQIMQLDLLTPSDLSFNQMLLISVETGFLPTIKYLLDKAGSEQYIDLNKALNKALEKNHFNLAIFLIVHGAQPDSIPTSGEYLRSFHVYLQNFKNAEDFDKLFSQEEFVKIQQRVLDIEHISFARRSSVYHDICTAIVEFINWLLPDSFRLGYNDKTNVIDGVEQFFKSQLHRQSIFGSSIHNLRAPLKFSNQKNTITH